MSSEKYGLPIRHSNIEDNDHNVTRFLVLGPSLIPRTGDAPFKTSIMVGLKDKVGALHDMLIPFKNHEVNLTMIESRPSGKQAWEYYFFIDFEGYYEEPRPAACLEDLSESCREVRILGSYPRCTDVY
jgi:chorismate mutase/prephenate dehydratase